MKNEKPQQAGQGVKHIGGEENVSQSAEKVKLHASDIVRFSLFESVSVLTKRYALDPQGEPEKQPGGHLSRGTVTRMECTPREFVAMLPGLTTTQALDYGVPSFEHATIVARDKLPEALKNATGPVIARTNEHFSWPPGPGIMMLDFDPQDGAEPLTRAQARALVGSVWRDTAQSPQVWADSASTHIYTAETGEMLKGAGGLRCYLCVRDARDIPRAGKALVQRLMLAGHGWVKLSGAGTLLPRVPIDSSVWQPERLDFAAGADCVPPLEQRRPQPELHHPDAPYLDTRTMPDLTADEQAQCRAVVQALKAAAQPEADRIREQWLDSRVQAQAQAQRVTDPKEVQRIRQTLQRAAQTSRLGPEIELVTSTGELVTVAELLADRARWHGTEFHDPLERDYGNDPRIAVALLTGDRPRIFSHAHGGQTFFLDGPTADGESDWNPGEKKPEQNERKPRRRALRRDDLMKLPNPSYTVKHTIPSRGLAAVFGPSGTGKSFLTLDMGAAIAEARTWFGCRTKQRSVVIVCLEGQSGYKPRVQAWEAHHGRQLPSKVVFTPDPLDIRKGEDTDGLIEFVLAEAGEGVLVIIDTLNRSAPGMDENGGKDYGLILSSASRVEQAVKGAVLFVAHPGKNPAAGLRGHSSFHAGLDAVIGVNAVKEDDLLFAWTILKAKDGRAGIEHHFKRVIVDLGTDDDGDPVTSCVIVPDTEADQQATKGKARTMTKAESNAFLAFRQAAIEFGEVDTNGKFTGLSLGNWRDYFYLRCNSDKSDVKRSAFNKAKTALVKGGWLVEDVYGNLTLTGPGADIHAEVIEAAIIEKSQPNPTEPNRTQTVPRYATEAQKRTEPYLPPFRGGTGTHGPGTFFDRKNEPTVPRTAEHIPTETVDLIPDEVVI